MPEQQLPPDEHVSPSVVQLPPSPVQWPPVHSLLQHWAAEVHAPPAMAHVVAVEQWSVSGSQESEQHSLDSAHVTPADLHSFGPLQRFTPSTSWSQC